MSEFLRLAPRRANDRVLGAPRLSVVVPAFNEEQRLGPTIDALLGWIDICRMDAEILVVDDGSRDGTSRVARRTAERDPRVRALGYSSNRGKGFAVKTGVLAALGEEILFSDADLSTPIEEYHKLRDRLARGFDVAIGSRHLGTSEILVKQPVHRRSMGRVFNAVVSLIGVRGFADTQCGFKLFRREAALRLFSRLRTDGFAFDVELLIRAREEGYRVAEVPVRWANSCTSRVRPVRDSIRMLREILKIRGVC